MQNISKEDIEFLDSFLSDELTEEGLKKLDVRLLDSDFKEYYEHRLREKYDKSIAKVVADYLPMIIMVALVIIGVYLFITST
ncbi:MAG: hypothetical protein ACJA1A_001244 [Saprospiraceae bacterium]|jgi:hypothetical protein